MIGYGEEYPEPVLDKDGTQTGVVVPMGLRALRITKASDIPIRPVRWIWHNRLPLGSLALIGGREGIGKSTIAYTLVAAVTRGRLPGIHHGNPKAVVIAATEDSWSHTIVPRLMAAGADLELVYRIDVITSEGNETGLILPKDITAVEDTLHETGAVMLLLDPLMSRLDGNLDSHKDADVRRALEPFSAIAGKTGALFLGIIHVNKSANTDPLTLLMGSRAFAAVARAVLFVMKDSEDETLRLLGQPKNNLGRNDLPMLTFRIEGQRVAETEEGPVWTSVVSWQGERTGSVDEALNIASGTSEDRTAVGDAKEWIVDYLTSLGGTAPSADIKQYGKKAGHSESSIIRARDQLKLTKERVKASPPFSYWSLPNTQPHSPNGANANSSPQIGTEPPQPDTIQSVHPLGESELNGLFGLIAGQSVAGDLNDPIKQTNPQGPPARAREKPPICDDCGESIDSTFHANTCEAE